MSFSILPEEIQIKILNMLTIGSRYNASLVWEELVYETMRSIPKDGKLIRKLKDGFGVLRNRDIVRRIITALDRKPVLLRK